MRLIDSSAWIEALIDSPTGSSVVKLLPSKEQWLVPTIVQLELAKWLTREVGAEKADQVIAFTQTCIVAELTTEVALAAAELKLPIADSIIYATARAYGAELITCDRHFNDLPGVTLIAKR